jgi:hypothetical protein
MVPFGSAASMKVHRAMRLIWLGNTSAAKRSRWSAYMTSNAVRFDSMSGPSKPAPMEGVSRSQAHVAALLLLSAQPTDH